MRVTTTTEVDDVRLVVSGEVCPDPADPDFALVTQVEVADEDGRGVEVCWSDERRVEEALVEKWAELMNGERAA